ncbi:STAS domain-containing protein [Actinoplanes awajinensis]|uniref:STAS domain-containing protein n=1 Tax=Actinoplanes awajinensis subsp. mycoplanecinus TaxID=135947 RepID=A0A117MQV6_9ACTN|nr:STAS domain-containing protein [Actinoplanes awajinensis]KUL30832.1 hypothetical protein ADL15_22975 [Actinoplanes awajinensis subsp. mycoplanecinus]
MSAADDGPAPPAGSVTVSAQVIGRTLHIAVAGDLAFEARDVLDGIPGRWLTAQVRHVVLDVAEVGFCDATGLRLLAHTLTVSREHGASFTLRNPPDHLCWLLGLAGATRLLRSVTDNISEREQSLRDRELLADERDRLLDERRDRVEAHQVWEDLREDLANERERKLDRRDQES